MQFLMQNIFCTRPRNTAEFENIQDFGYDYKVFLFHFYFFSWAC